MKTEDATQQNLMSTEEAKKLLWQAHEKLWNACGNLKEEYQSTPWDGKWSAVQHVQHINKGSGGYARYLTMSKADIESKFGLAKSPSRTFQEVKEANQEMLRLGGKSTERFNPDDSQSLNLVIEKTKGKQIVESLIQALTQWTESDLDRYVCPHPNMGAMTAREMLYFTILHAEHHTEGIKKIVPVAQIR